MVLVHGAWHGGWAWGRCAKALEALGHPVRAPTLPGLAERKGERAQDISLATHVDAVVAALDGLTGAVLVGHSYAGLVITGAAAKAAPSLRALVYLDAFVPEPHQCFFDLMKAEYSKHWRERAAKDGGGLVVPPMLSAKAMGVSDPKDQAWVDRQLTPQPLRTLEDPLEFDPRALDGLVRRYVRCAQYPGFGPTAKRVASLGWKVDQLDAGHDAMVTVPDALAALLHGV
ncbi:MAG: alpha/beta fold hydrolase [Myxococcaceae bacterium]|nr:alpha/beta fold hydrolase [Myxococcaceae bacterium]